MDIQGINHVTRQRLRQNRLETYPRYLYRGVQCPLDSLKDIPKPSPTRYLKPLWLIQSDYPSYEHHQLRNLVCCPEPSSLYFTSLDFIKCLNPLTQSTSILIDLEAEQKLHFKVTSLAANKDILVAGSMAGEYLLKRMEDETLIHGVITGEFNAITNHLRMLENRNVPKLLISSNDLYLRTMDLNTLKLESKYLLDWAPNFSAASPDGNLLAVVGDSTESSIISSNSGQVISNLSGHLDYSFACAWSPNGRILATSSQDLTTRLYDTRKLSQTLTIIPSEMSCVRSLDFDPTGLLMMAETADFIHILDNNCTQSQLIDFFGEISGCAWSANGDLLVGVADPGIGGIMNFEKINLLADLGLEN